MTEETLKGKTAIITGGGRGLGKAIARAYVQAGAQVLITAARSYEELERSAIEIGAWSQIADVTHDTDVALVVDLALKEFGHIDILVNNAARGMRMINERYLTDPLPFWHVDADDWRLMVDTNINGPFLMSRAVVPHMLENGWGRVINICADPMTFSQPGWSPYGPSKAALDAMSEIWARDVDGTGVTVNRLLPGGDAATAMFPPAALRDRRDTFLSPEVIGPPAVYLASDDAADVNGARINALAWNEERGIELVPSQQTD